MNILKHTLIMIYMYTYWFIIYSFIFPSRMYSAVRAHVQTLCTHSLCRTYALLSVEMCDMLWRWKFRYVPETWGKSTVPELSTRAVPHTHSGEAGALPA